MPHLHATIDVFGLEGVNNGHVRLGLMRFSQVFHNIYGKVWDPIDLPTLREDVATTFSILEWELLEAIFDVMMHLTLHVVEELDICGLIHSRWIYPIKRALKTFKGYVLIGQSESIHGRRLHL